MENPNPIPVLSLIVAGAYLVMCICIVRSFNKKSVSSDQATLRIMACNNSRITGTGLILLGFVILLLSEGAWAMVLPLTVIGTGAFQLAYFKHIKPRFEEEAVEHTFNESICGLDFEVEDTDTSVQIWFKKTKQDWPKVQMELGMGSFAHDITKIEASKVNGLQCVLKRFGESTSDQNKILAIRQSLEQHGVVHKIDVAGWDHCDFTKKITETIFESKFA